MDYFLLKGPKSDQLRATDLARPFEYSPCPSVVTHNKIQRANDLWLEVKHSEHNETMIWSYGGYLTVHSSLTKGMRDAGLTGFQLRPTTVQFRDGELSQDYSELIVTGWAGIARPESGIKLIESCSGCFRNGADAGNGADGQPGGNGQNGGLVVLTTVVNPASSTIDVSGGQAGSGGLGGAAGAPGRAGAGGRGCTGLGGSQPNQAGGLPGRPGQTGRPGLSGQPGAPGEYRLQVVRSFDSIVEKVKALQNAQLHSALQTQ